MPSSSYVDPTRAACSLALQCRPQEAEPRRRQTCWSLCAKRHVGATRVAPRSMQHASKVTASNMPTTALNVAGSVAVTPYNRR